MAEKTQINPKLSPERYAQFLAYCKAHGRTQSDVVEAALEAWFTPSGTGTDTQMILDKLREQEAGIKKLVDAITKLITQQAAPPPPLPVAGPDVLYAGWQKPSAAAAAPVAVEAEASPAPRPETVQEEEPIVQRRMWFGFARRAQ
jgi:hypothetical protein